MEYFGNYHGELPGSEESKQWEADASQENTDAMICLGQMHQKWNAPPYKAIPWFTKAAELGNNTGMFLLAASYEKGFGVDKDSSKATKWYNLAAFQGHLRSMFALAHIYECVQQDYKQAKVWFDKAAAKNYPKAMFRISLLYEKGLGVEKDFSKAKQWLNKAIAYQDSSAILYNKRPKNPPAIEKELAIPPPRPMVWPLCMTEHEHLIGPLQNGIACKAWFTWVTKQLDPEDHDIKAGIVFEYQGTVYNRYTGCNVVVNSWVPEQDREYHDYSYFAPNNFVTILFLPNTPDDFIIYQNLNMEKLAQETKKHKAWVAEEKRRKRLLPIWVKLKKKFFGESL